MDIMAKRFYRCKKDADTCYTAGKFIDTQTDKPEREIDALLADGIVEAETPVWWYYCIAPDGGRTITFDASTKDEALAIGKRLYDEEPDEHKATMRECGVVYGMPDASIFTDSGRGIAFLETLVWNW